MTSGIHSDSNNAFKLIFIGFEWTIIGLNDDNAYLW